MLNSTVTILSKKHGQLKAAVQAIVELTMSWLAEVKSQDGVERWLELVETLRGVTEGKVCVDIPPLSFAFNLSSLDIFRNPTSAGYPPSLALS